MPLPMVPAPTTPIVLMFVISLIAGRNWGSDHLDGESNAVAAAETERGNAALQSAVLESVEQRREHASAAGTDGVTERHGATVDVHPCLVESELLDNGDSLHRERLVQ